MKMKKNVWTLLSVVALACVTLLSSCLDNDNNTPSTPQSILSVLHAAPGLGGLDLYMNSDKKNSDVINYKDNLAGQVNSATYDIVFEKAASKDTLIRLQDSLEAGFYYSAILYDTASAVDLMLFKDQFGETQNQGDAYLRFLHLSPDDDVVSIYAGTDELKSSRHFADNLANPSLAKFEPLSGGSYSFTALDANGDTLGQVKNAELQSGGAYTLYLSGYATATVDSLKLKLSLVQTY